MDTAATRHLIELLREMGVDDMRGPILSLVNNAL